MEKRLMRKNERDIIALRIWKIERAQKKFLDKMDHELEALRDIIGMPPKKEDSSGS